MSADPPLVFPLMPSTGSRESPASLLRSGHRHRDLLADRSAEDDSALSSWIWCTMSLTWPGLAVSDAIAHSVSPSPTSTVRVVDRRAT